MKPHPTPHHVATCQRGSTVQQLEMKQTIYETHNIFCTLADYDKDLVMNGPTALDCTEAAEAI